MPKLCRVVPILVSSSHCINLCCTYVYSFSVFIFGILTPGEVVDGLPMYICDCVICTEKVLKQSKFEA